ncbi:PASTA domain-containing protein [Candidatus Enterococcus leclercqii]|uniref:PASTA domain-containing protein n=1 Tax=Candidatus Enterococcus leclercqii TaxID=1857218 RepID=UPI001379DA61|nr:PASTA domain-containing protein [Enterococcus sp. CU9D]KAF1290280.1 PASTA domain-containing protein [Enterococcus sp. CU9D]
MSDFLSNFSKENYDGKKKLASSKVPEADLDENFEKEFSTDASPSKAEETEKDLSRSQRMNRSFDPAYDQRLASPTAETEERLSEETTESESGGRFQAEETEFDPTYKKRRIRKIALLSGAAIAVFAGLFFLYYSLTHVLVPDFSGKAVAEARSWGSEAGVKVETKQVYDFKAAINEVISQSAKAGEKLKKGTEMTVTVSMGPDPEEIIPLPDFANLTVDQATAWIEEKKAENVTIIREFDKQITDGGFIKMEAASKDQDLEKYKRQDRLNVYYSKGKEVFEKNITVTDFTNKPLSEVSDWAKTNGVKLTTEKIFSETIAADNVVSQETAKGTKIAKNDTLKLKVSKGKPIRIPDYSQYTIEQAQSLEGGISAVIKSVYSDSVGYGRFISQSVEAGKEFAEEDKLPSVEVVYSQGRPYIKDLRGQTTEGDLPKLFFDEFQAKGADITYSVYYVDSAEPKGTVIEMSKYGEFLPLTATISIGISLGNKQAEIPPVSDPSLPTEDSDTTATTETQQPADNQETSAVKNNNATLEANNSGSKG